MHEQIVNKDVRYLRENCPISCSSVTGTGPGECKCCPGPEPKPTPPPVKQDCCVHRYVVRRSGTYQIGADGSVQRVCT